MSRTPIREGEQSPAGTAIVLLRNGYGTSSGGRPLMRLQTVCSSDGEVSRHTDVPGVLRDLREVREFRDRADPRVAGDHRLGADRALESCVARIKARRGAMPIWPIGSSTI